MKLSSFLIIFLNEQVYYEHDDIERTCRWDHIQSYNTHLILLV